MASAHHHVPRHHPAGVDLAALVDRRLGELGHSSVRVTQDIYIHVHGDVYQRLYDATG